MEHQLATKPVQKEQTNQASPSSSLLQASPDRITTHPLLKLQRTIGNQAVQAMMRSGRLGLQAKEYESDVQALTSPAVPVVQRTGLPDSLKAGVESLSGISMDDVHVHYNSSKPAQVQALAYTQGTEIHVGPGQEQHLAHEAWHVVQQKQGRVRPTLQMKGVAINDDQGLEREADQIGVQASALQQQPVDVARFTSGRVAQLQSAVIQRAITVQNIDFDPVGNVFRHGIIQQAQFYVALRAAIWGDSQF